MALLSFKSHSSTSLLVKHCKEKINFLGQTSDITLVWIPTHRELFGNEQADELARFGSALCITNAESVDIPLGVIRNNILKHFPFKSGNRWRVLGTYNIANLI